MVSSAPEPGAPVPGAVAAVAAGRPVRAVWSNEAGGMTFEVGTGGGRCYVKWAPAGSRIDLAREVPRLTWAGRFIRVPRVLAHGRDGTGAWLVTAALPGRSAVDPRWVAEPRTAVTAIGEGLRAMHETLPAAACPFSWSAPDRVADAHRRAAAGKISLADDDWPGEPMCLRRALEFAADIPPVTQQVVCHGDSCSPNTLLTDDGRWSGHVDLGALGVADRWADLAVATWATQWNYGPGWEKPLLDAYGIAADEDLIRYYRVLWVLGD